MGKEIKIERMVDGKPVIQKYDLKLNYDCGCDPCDCYLIPEERLFCAPDCRCYEEQPECGCK